jgi:hypothetical protein
MSEMFVAAFGRCDPMSIGPRRIVPYVLLMSTLKVRNPIEVLIRVEANDLSRNPNDSCSFRFHQRHYTRWDWQSNRVTRGERMAIAVKSFGHEFP